MEKIEVSRQDRLLSLSQTAASTPMGKLLRQFWQPVALSSELKPKSAKAIRVMSEDLTLYRGESGKAYLVGSHCLHRLTLLHTGWVEGEEIRCMYHGWKYSGAGRCVERPAETAPLSDKIRIAGYPTYEYAGLIFAYMGPGEAPNFDLPRRKVLERSGDITVARAEGWPCNWFQHVENSLDPVHVSFAHMMGRVGEFGQAITEAIPELSYEETSAGIKQTAVRPGNSIRISNWTFPNCNYVRLPGIDKDDPWIDSINWMVPIDDKRTARFSARHVPSSTPEADDRIRKYFEEVEHYHAADDHDALFHRKEYPEDPLIELTSAQDYVVLVGQGAIADRARELLGRSDKGIAFLRSIFYREMDAIVAQRPSKTWRSLDQEHEERTMHPHSDRVSTH